jgi:hypothetical protein
VFSETRTAIGNYGILQLEAPVVMRHKESSKLISCGEGMMKFIAVGRHATQSRKI